jgi:ApaG protein
LAVRKRGFAVPREIRESSTALTDGVQIAVRARYVAEGSFPSLQRYVFAYTVRIQNEGARVVQLLGRHWVVADCTGYVQRVRGAGVVGEQPILRPGAHFEYTSTTTLSVPRGQMRGTYQMRDLAGHPFDAVIAPFLLALPRSHN